MFRVLIAEDDPDIQELLQAYLAEEGYDTVPAMDGEQALERFHEGRIDLVLLDVMMPRLDGYGVCRAIRAESDVPIIMLTALDGEAHQLKGFDLRIDDYVTKPFSMPVLLRKVEAVLRRTTGQGGSRQIVYRELLLDLDGYAAYVGGAKAELTRREFELLKALLQNQGRVLSRQALLNRVWGYDFYGDERIVDTHVKNLRKKLGGDYIETIRGVGYRVDREHQA
ncbi:MAG: response regulator transcription factor [Clostridiales bacterium]|nr:response regulator transcription factor [Clostridiales bacterium]